MLNIPKVKMGIVAVSRDCFPIALSQTRRSAVVQAVRAAGGEIYECPVIVEGGIDANVMDALNDVNRAGVNALVVYLGNFGPEHPEVLLAKKFAGPVMFIAAAEETIDVLSSNRGDAYCGIQSEAPRRARVYPRISRRHGGGVRGHDSGFSADCARDAGAERSEDHHVRPASGGFLCLQRADRAAV